jgi:hypothetical protein
MNIMAHVYLECWSMPLSCGFSPGVVTLSWSTWTVLPGVGLVALIPAGSVLEHHNLCCDFGEQISAAPGQQAVLDRGWFGWEFVPLCPLL